jgi:hypothetical protein
MIAFGECCGGNVLGVPTGTCRGYVPTETSVHAKAYVSLTPKGNELHRLGRAVRRAKRSLPPSVAGDGACGNPALHVAFD